MTKRAGRPGELHPIQIVARRTGLTPDVLRAWERRYEAITPGRTEGSRRLYSDADIERLILLRRATNAGRSIGQVAALPTDRLRRLVEEDESAAPAGDGASAAKGESPDSAGGAGMVASALVSTGRELEMHRGACLAAVEDLDVAALETAVDRALLSFGPLIVCDRILVPLMDGIGRAWAHGSLGIVHEHLASAVVRTILGSIASGYTPGHGAPGIVVATPAGSLHELGAMMAVVTALSCGWRTTYLGPNLPADEIATGVRARAARALALGLTYPPTDPKIADELRRLRRELPDTPIIVGGEAALSYGPALDGMRAMHHATMAELRETLSRLSGEVH